MPWDVDRVTRLLEHLKFGTIIAIAPKASNLRKFEENEAPSIDLNIK
jgi:hypothetical protein